MFTKRRALFVALAIIGVGLVLGLTAFSVSIVSEAGSGGRLANASADLTSIPQSIADDAARVAARLFGRDGARYENFVDDLLAVHAAAADKDFLILFNPGGWGNREPDDTSDWGSILQGIESYLAGHDSDTLVLTYHRTANSVRGCLGELWEVRRGYSTKAEALALRIQFLTSHYPDLKIVITGESMGSLICSEAMNILADNPQVFSIQTGPPPWYRADNNGRTLVITDNGTVPDTFSRGDIITIIATTLAELLGKSQTADERGTILLYFYAPGHSYSWQYPAVSSRITQFFEETIGVAE